MRRAVESADMEVSIHAPARGATREGEELEAAVNVSIHAPARGATRRAKNLGDD